MGTYIELAELEARYEMLKRKRSSLARSARQDAALYLSKEMANIAEQMYKLDPSPARWKNLQYAKYYEAVSGGVVAELSGDFARAQVYADLAARTARSFRESQRFFPNFFFDELDIATRDEILAAVKAFSEGNFLLAASHFDKWLVLNSHRKGKGDSKFDGHEFHHQIAVALDNIQSGRPYADHWYRLENFLALPGRNIFRTTRALWDQVEPLKFAALRGPAQFPGGHDALERLIKNVQDHWPLLSSSAPLVGQDRSASLEEPVRLPTFLDIALDLPHYSGHGVKHV
jgi:hypothetical protein